MRGLKSTVALLVLLIGLGAYIYFVTWESTGGDSSTREKVFAGVDPAQIEEVTVRSEAGDTTTARKESGAWQIVAPVAAAASESDVSGLTYAFEQMDLERVIEEKPTDLKLYGLDTPRLEVSFKSGGGKPSGRLLVGAKTPTGGGVYATRNDEPRVFLIPEFHTASLNKSTFDLRDKTVMKFERDKTDGIEVMAGGKPIRFAKEATDWQLTAPLAARADNGSVEGLIGRVHSAQMKAVAAEQPTPAELKKFGLEKPAATVTFNQGSARATIAIGGSAGSDTVYARDVSRPQVVTVESSLADDLKKAADDYRRKDVFEFRAYSATRAELTRDGQTVAFERTKGEGENAQDGWKRVSPSAADADRSKVESMLAGLADMRATEFAASTAKTGLDKPVLTVAVKFEEGKKDERVAFGQSGSDVYAQVAGQPGALKIDAQKFAEAIKALDELAK